MGCFEENKNNFSELKNRNYNLFNFFEKKIKKYLCWKLSIWFCTHYIHINLVFIYVKRCSNIDHITNEFVLSLSPFLFQDHYYWISILYMYAQIDLFRNWYLVPLSNTKCFYLILKTITYVIYIMYTYITSS